MYNKLFADIMRFVALILFQLFIVDNIRLGYYIHPVVYILFILLMPYNAQRWQVMLAAFGMGMIIDFFPALRDLMPRQPSLLLMCAILLSLS